MENHINSNRFWTPQECAFDIKKSEKKKYQYCSINVTENIKSHHLRKSIEIQFLSQDKGLFKLFLN
jgi:hypothetical protein